MTDRAVRAPLLRTPVLRAAPVLGAVLVLVAWAPHAAPAPHAKPPAFAAEASAPNTAEWQWVPRASLPENEIGRAHV